jgi:outer membrane biogenesis lipoprotein LolB
MWKGAMAATVFFLLAACAADEKQLKVQQDENAKAVAEADAQLAQQDHARCLTYGQPGSAAYIDCRSSLKNDRAFMKK